MAAGDQLGDAITARGTYEIIGTVILRGSPNPPEPASYWALVLWV